MSAPLDDLMGNALTEPIADMDDEKIEVTVVDDRPEEDQVPPSSSTSTTRSGARRRPQRDFAKKL